ncbi:MAG: aspartyl/glutamyl-tRNA amidotransferase subunit A [Gammaproteobacteria bacterium RIFCSPLOWO2_02_FULL_42_14]|nr:MAG: aspartyl/glutamyl-tRNA amidotransferase subunit A [Gammaproteobacteria bacterium RIFCSPHIGHO2_02_FULL_42_43]OGT52993.1 MAG: aspartyl/glutamyl-tRNA amidotransferase subunit A [Gammaproteobacteria bacterium RIFCSPHIGHO2_12_FULL_41_25]OGT61235.1 MAG: aspartyl/glutamyl-tRNA amidotransferase subunit A [Gammaproteobacteria bacterium RIFCSPLOWO2_02_FULL_42_14]OGT87162.1 MAG: aspartyl/glutamyl-tRNA amidotransferase subunit A [Gammaproteobacteria bacterium RIFCSPLOWO2_12_FULL_42_18]
MHRHTVATLSKLLHDKKISSVELTKHFLARIKQFSQTLNAFITVTEENALQQAKIADEKRAGDHASTLTGIPIAQKDVFCTKNIKTTCASKILHNFVAPYDATSVEKCNAQNLVLLGKTNMDEFAMGSSNENSFFGPVKNPWDMTCTPGGSSGGSAASVAARLTPIATGTDTGGSIRQPAALCGITGLKPTYGRVSRYGMIAFASSLDQGGILSQTAEDAALLLNVIAGHDVKDSTSINQAVPDYTKTLNDTIKNRVIGLPQEYFTGGLDPSVEKNIQDAIHQYEKLGARFKKISLPHTDLATSAYYVIAPAEASSNLARYDGVRYGYRCDNPKNLDDLYKRSRTEGFGDEVKRRIMIGTYVLSSGFYDAYYLKAQKIRRLILNDFVKAFESVDCILTPTAPTPAFKLGEKSTDPVAMYLSDIFTIAVNLAGLPGISIPAGFVNQLPIGLQLIGKHFEEGMILNLAHQFQQATDWHARMPKGF